MSPFYFEEGPNWKRQKGIIDLRDDVGASLGVGIFPVFEDHHGEKIDVHVNPESKHFVKVKGLEKAIYPGQEAIIVKREIEVINGGSKETVRRVIYSKEPIGER